LITAWKSKELSQPSSGETEAIVAHSTRTPSGPRGSGVVAAGMVAVLPLVLGMSDSALIRPPPMH
jgi:hypothetical protein